MSVEVTVDKTREILAAIAAAGKQHVLIGIPATENGRNDGSIGNATLGYLHENGSAANNVPARPFLNPGVKDIADKAADVFEIATKEMFDDPAAVTKALNRVGLLGQASVKNRIVSQVGFAPLMAATIRARERKGFRGTKALIRTGQLLNSITYVIRDR